MKRAQQGFTLVEIMIAVAIIAILSAVALPAYSDYVTRGRLTEAMTTLGGAQASAEQYWSNSRSYTGFPNPQTTANFTYAVSNATASSYTLTATGTGKMAGFIYTVDQSGNRTTTGSPTGWGTSTNCWVDKKGGGCSN
jgi:type IV pilus assembly protein PilE